VTKVRSNEQLIKNYRLEVQDCIEGDLLSPFDTIHILTLRDELEKRYCDLTAEEKKNLLVVDLKLLKNAEVFYSELRRVYKFGADKPLENWWVHIDKVVSGDLVVDLGKRKVRNSGKKMAVIRVEGGGWA